MEANFNSAILLNRNASPHQYTPWLFQHPNLLNMDGNHRTLDLGKLINKLNYINFNDGHIFFLLNQRITKTQVMIKASPQLCGKGDLISLLAPSDAVIDLKNYELNHLIIDDGFSTIISPVQAISLEKNIIKVALPEISQIKSLRKNRRYSCEDITCKIVQGDFMVRGRLLDFSTGGLGVILGENASIHGFDETKPALLSMNHDDQPIFSGMCLCVRNRFDAYDSKLVFAPLHQQYSLFPKRDIRNIRQQIGNAFSISFHHPFFKSPVERDIFDISLAGFSIKDTLDEDVLLPGMFLPELSIIYAGILRMKCSAQVVYREMEKETSIVKYGLAVVDMDLQAYTHLSQVLGVSNNTHARFSTTVEMDALWEFFFDTGFINAEKFENIRSHRNEFKETYRKLYRDNPEIARHILYKKNGKIYSHVAMIHAYEPSWLIHHFAARNMDNRQHGMMFLKHVIQYLGPFQRMQSATMMHYMTYYQAKNDIVERLFDNFNQHVNDSKKCSVDAFSHIQFHKKNAARKLPDEWQVRECTLRDLSLLKDFYEEVSGGLLLSALGLDLPADSLKKSFAQAGFKREYRTHCLCHQDKPLAFFIVNQSDIKLNLSDLINGIKIIIVEPDILSWAMLAATVNRLGVFFQEDIIPLLIYPSYFLPLQNIPMEKEYSLWILHAKAGDEWLSYMNRLANIQMARR